MKFFLLKSYEELSRRNAEIMFEIAKRHPQDFALGTSTGSTFAKTYPLFTQLCRENDIFVKAVQQQDFYAGNMEYQVEIWNSVVSKLPGNPEFRFTCWDMKDATREACCQIHENNWRISRNEFFLQLLGIGVEGHIGFNEACDNQTSDEIGVHTLELSVSTRKANSRFYKNISEVPTHTITSGIKNILEDTKMIIFSASGENKAKAVRDALFGPINNECPASFLQLYKKEIIVTLDEAAASLIDTSKLLEI